MKDLIDIAIGRRKEFTFKSPGEVKTVFYYAMMYDNLELSRKLLEEYDYLHELIDHPANSKQREKRKRDN